MTMWIVVFSLVGSTHLATSQLGGPPMILKPSSSRSDYKFEILSSSVDASTYNKYECQVTAGIGVQPNWVVASAIDPTATTQYLNSTNKWSQLPTVREVQPDGSTLSTRTLYTSSFRMTAEDNHVFRCIVEGTIGGQAYTIVSSPIKIVICEVFEVRSSDSPLSGSGEKGLPCHDHGYIFRPPQILKRAEFTWNRICTNAEGLPASELLNTDVEGITGNSNVMITNDGRLHFIPALMGDYETDLKHSLRQPVKWLYRCYMKTRGIGGGVQIASERPITKPPQSTVNYTGLAHRLMSSSLPSDQGILEGEIWKGFCLVSPQQTTDGVRYPFVHWTFNGSTDPPAGLKRSKKEGFTNIEFPVSENVLVACGIEGQAPLKTAQLTVIKKLRLPSPEYMIDKHIGLSDKPQSVVFSCPLKVARVNWLIKGETLKMSTIKRLLGNNSQTLVFSDIQKSDMGVISCFAVVPAGEFLEHARLFVYDDPKIVVTHDMDEPTTNPWHIVFRLRDHSSINAPSSQSESNIFIMTAVYSVDALAQDYLGAWWKRVGEDVFPIDQSLEEYITEIIDNRPKGKLTHMSQLKFDFSVAKNLTRVEGQYFFRVKYTNCPDENCLVFESNSIRVEHNSERPGFTEGSGSSLYYVIGILIGALLFAAIIVGIGLRVRTNGDENEDSKMERRFVIDPKLKEDQAFKQQFTHRH